MNLTNVNLVSDYNYKDSETKDGKRRNRWNKSQNTGKVVYSIVSITSYLYFLYRFLVFLSCFLVLFPLVLSCFFSFSGLVLILLTFIDMYVYLYLWIKYVLYCMYVCILFIYSSFSCFLVLFLCSLHLLRQLLALLRGQGIPVANNGRAAAIVSRRAAVHCSWNGVHVPRMAPRSRSVERWRRKAPREISAAAIAGVAVVTVFAVYMWAAADLWGGLFLPLWPFPVPWRRWSAGWRTGGLAGVCGVVESSQIQAVQTTAWRGEALVFVSLVNGVRGAKRVD